MTIDMYGLIGTKYIYTRKLGHVYKQNESTNLYWSLDLLLYYFVEAVLSTLDCEWVQWQMFTCA